MKSLGARLAWVGLALVGCGGGEGDSSAGAPTGAGLYKTNACHTCHGLDGAGTAQGPTLLALEQHWKREDLVEYFLAPQAFVQNDERLRAQTGRYPMRMASFAHLNEEERGLVADYVLAFGD